MTIQQTMINTSGTAVAVMIYDPTEDGSNWTPGCPPPPPIDNLVSEDGDNLVTESGDNIIGE